MKKGYALLLMLFLSTFALPLTSARYYVVMDPSLGELRGQVKEIADMHNGAVVIANISRSNLTFLGGNDTVLFVINASKFDDGLVYSIYKKLDHNGDGIYDPVVGFLPVNSYAGLKKWIESLTQALKNKNSYALFICPPCSPKTGFNGNVYYLYGKYATYEAYEKYSKNASLIWVAGHGDPTGVDLLYWKFDNYHAGNVSKKAFIFEACSVGMIWRTKTPLVLSLLNNGSPAVVASIDSGGVSYFPQEYWVSNYTLGKLVQINNAYFIKIGLPPKDVVFGDPAFKFKGSEKFVRLPYGQIGYVDRILVPKINNYAYLPQEPPLFLLIDSISPLDIWRSIVTENGMFAMIIAVGAVLIGSNISKFKKREAVPALIAPLLTLLLLSLVAGDMPLNIMFEIYLSWSLITVATYKNHRLLFAVLLAPIIFFIVFGTITGLISTKYSIFLLVAGILSTSILWLLLKANLLLIEKLEIHLGR